MWLWKCRLEDRGQHGVRMTAPPFTDVVGDMRPLEVCGEDVIQLSFISIPK